MPGANETFTVTVVSVQNPLQSAALALTASVPRYDAQAGLNPQALAGPPGAALTSTLRLTNTGNPTDTYALAPTGRPRALVAPSAVWHTEMPS